MTDLLDLLDKTKADDDKIERRDNRGLDVVLNPPECDTDSNGDSDDSDNPSGDTTKLSG